MHRNLVLLRNLFKYFSKNKNWILSTLFVFSIIKDCVWYACFGISILTYSSIQDTFVSFFNYLITFVVIFLLYIFVGFMPTNSKNEIQNYTVFFIQLLIFLFLSTIFFIIFKKVMSLLSLFIFLIFLYKSYSEKKYLDVLRLLIISFVCLTIVEPLIYYNEILNKQQDIQNGRVFKLTEGNMEFFSFTYKDQNYDTKSKRYYLIGNTSNYFFLFDNIQDKSLIFPKSDCINIKADTFIMWDFNKDKLF